MTLSERSRMLGRYCVMSSYSGEDVVMFCTAVCSDAFSIADSHFRRDWIWLLQLHNTHYVTRNRCVLLSANQIKNTYKRSHVTAILYFTRLSRNTHWYDLHKIWAEDLSPWHHRVLHRSGWVTKILRFGGSGWIGSFCVNKIYKYPICTQER